MTSNTHIIAAVLKVLFSRASQARFALFHTIIHTLRASFCSQRLPCDAGPLRSMGTSRMAPTTAPSECPAAEVKELSAVASSVNKHVFSCTRYVRQRSH